MLSLQQRSIITRPLGFYGNEMGANEQMSSLSRLSLSQETMESLMSIESGSCPRDTAIEPWVSRHVRHVKARFRHGVSILNLPASIIIVVSYFALLIILVVKSPNLVSSPGGRSRFEYISMNESKVTRLGRKNPTRLFILHSNSPLKLHGINIRGYYRS